MTILFWIGFLAFIGCLLALDLGVFHKTDDEPTVASALRWTFVWVLVGLSFAGFIYGAYDHHWFGIGLDVQGNHLRDGRLAAVDFVTGYLIEYSLSLDNIFVMAMIFSFFGIPGKYQHRTLFWGILGAIVLRAALILAGTALVRSFDWILYVFGAFLVFTAVKMLFKGDEEIDPEHNWVVRAVRKIYPVSANLDGHRFMTRLPDGKKAATRLLLALVMVESTDVVFALDSIPAIFAVTTDPFLVFTSNIFAILGLRSLFFALSAMLDKFHLLKYSIVGILAFVGLKMLVAHWLHLSSPVSLAVIVAALGLGVSLSLLFPKAKSR
ncbi:MAG TPA: TerC family protein [Fibrobacteraceae bacterium]|nr:TerC family protein [Fibrobacteraceae bacterium]